MDNSAICREISLDYPGPSIPISSNMYRFLNKNLIRTFKEIKDFLGELIRNKDFEFDRRDLKISRNETFLGSNAISITNRDAKDKSSLAFMSKRKEDYLFCVKSDGTRYLWVILENGQQFFVSRKMDFFQSNVELPPFFFSKTRETLFMRKKVNNLQFKKEFMQAKHRVGLSGKFQQSGHVLGRFDHLRRRKVQNEDFVEGLIDSTDWDLANNLQRTNPNSTSQSNFHKMRPNLLYQLDPQMIKNTLKGTQTLFQGVTDENDMFEEWQLQRKKNKEHSTKFDIKFIFDGELIQNRNGDWEYLMFDTVMFQKKLVVHQDYARRLQGCNKFSNRCRFYGSFFKKALDCSRQFQSSKDFISEDMTNLNKIEELSAKSESSEDSLCVNENKESSPSPGQTHLRKRNSDCFKEGNTFSILETALLTRPKALRKIQLKTKDFYNYSKVHFLLRKVCNVDPFAGNSDGIIITRNKYPYVPGKSSGILKWKPDEMNSIDFFVVASHFANQNVRDKEKCRIYELYVLRNREMSLFDFMDVTGQHQIAEIEKLMREYTITNQTFTGAIVELVYDKKAQTSNLGKFSFASYS